MKECAQFGDPVVMAVKAVTEMPGAATACDWPSAQRNVLILRTAAPRMRDPGTRNPAIIRAAPPLRTFTRRETPP
ncbi:hypothetical protein GCM10011428_07500 [Streptomyces violaceus]